MLPHNAIEQRLKQAVNAVLPDAGLSTVLVRPCPDPKFGDYQSNALMSLAKARRVNPRQIATEVVTKLDVQEWCEAVEIAGAGFLNFRLKTSALANTLQSAARGEHLFFEKRAQPETVVVDFSSPNIAKPMHVGHIRSTILGDSLARLLRLLGNQVITDNHVGDWGTQFGMLLLGWHQEKSASGKEPSNIESLVEIYRRVQSEIKRQTHVELEKRYPDKLGELQRSGKSLEEACEIVLKDLGANKPLDLSNTDVDSRKELVKLQAGDPENTSIWSKMIELSEAEFETIYRRLGVHFDQALGESFYNPRLQPLLNELRERSIAQESEGAMVVFFPDNPQLKNHPALVQKSDGAFNYTSTDLATVAYRIETWHPDEIIYVTDGRQQLHFQQFFAVFRRWHPDAKVKLSHVWFGSILGEDGKPFKTRSGETVKLSDLLDEAEERALKVVSEKNPDLAEKQRREIARVVGIGAVKYADLLPNRQGDYVFSWDKMLALSGNTAPYLQYAYARIRSIFRKGEVEKPGALNQAAEIRLDAPAEISLAKHLLNFGLVLEAATEEYRPNFICNYLYDLAGRFTSFYENCPVLKSEPQQRASRLVLCELTARVLKQGLEVLGIETLEQM